MALIDVTFRLAPGAKPFPSSGTNTLKLSGLRVSAEIIKVGGFRGSRFSERNIEVI